MNDIKNNSLLIPILVTILYVFGLYKVVIELIEIPFIIEGVDTTISLSSLLIGIVALLAGFFIGGKRLRKYAVHLLPATSLAFVFFGWGLAMLSGTLSFYLWIPAIVIAVIGFFAGSKPFSLGAIILSVASVAFALLSPLLL